MKKIILAIVILSVSQAVFGKKVKFACDMTGVAVNVTGMHVSGDFQTAAGFAGGDWNSATTPLTQEGVTEIYSIVVDVPAFTKYEYKFVNGDQFYDAEFVPEYSRVGYNFNDNRWIYVDSLADDTMMVGPILFAQNAPAGMNLMRVFVDMMNETVSSNGVHVAGNFQGWDPQKTILYSFGPDNTNGLFIYEMLCYVPVGGTYEYKFYNGNSAIDGEVVPAICSVNSNRSVTMLGDTMLKLVCFASCQSCLTGIDEPLASSFIVAPNPSSDFTTISWVARQFDSLYITDVTGRVVKMINHLSENKLVLNRSEFERGIYFVHAGDSSSVAKIVFQ